MKSKLHRETYFNIRGIKLLTLDGNGAKTRYRVQYVSNASRSGVLH